MDSTTNACGVHPLLFGAINEAGMQIDPAVAKAAAKVDPMWFVKLRAEIYRSARLRHLT